MRLFEIGQEFEGLYSLLEDIEVDENGVVIDNSEAVAELYQELQTNLEDKLDASSYICKELISNADTLKAEAKRLTEKARTLENREKRIKQLMKEAIIQSGEMKLKTDKFSFSVRSSDVYNYDDVNMFGLSDEFIKVKQEIDKTKIKQYVKAGGTIEGVKVSEDTIMTVR
jgi:phage host-nuclease inhibitor protein Gam